MDLTIVIVTLVAMIFSAFFSGMEIAFVSSNRVRVEIDAAKGGVVNHIINKFYSNKEMFISTMLTGNNIMLVFYSMGMAKMLEPFLKIWLEGVSGADAYLLVIQTLVSTGIILITGEYLPKQAFRINPNDSLRTFALPLYLTYLILYPISWLSSALINGIMRIFREPKPKRGLGGITESELNAYVQSAIDTKEDDHEKVDREVKIFQNALDFSSTHLRDCMIPRNEMVAVNIDTTSHERLVKLFIESGLSKILVFQEDIDNILGYIHVCELYTPQTNWKERIKPVLFAPETMLASQMMQKLLSEKKSMVIVIDGFGGTAGFVTLEDLVEEIFGEIEDEHDRKRKSIIAKQTGSDSWEFSGRAEIERINEDFHLDIEESDDYQTLAGYISFNLEEIPEENATVEIGGYRFTILKKTAVKLELISMTKISPTPSAD